MKKIIKKGIQSLRRVVLYLRLSKEDLEKDSPEERSESIKNQELMLRKYAEEQGWTIVGVYDDEDFSGSDRDRPNFNKMIKECEAGNVDIVLVKTQARFARDMTLIDLYVHNKFKEWGVRFFTYIEHIDNNKKETKKTSQIIAMTDEWYLEDTSENIRATLRAKKEDGLFTGSFAPYGYLKDPDDKNHLIIDPVASEVVKKIFELYNSGWGYYKIISYLDDARIPSPLDYKKMNGSKIHSPSMEIRGNISSISKKGNYIITNTIENNEKSSVINIYSIGMLTESNSIGEKVPNYVDLYVRRLDNGLKIFTSSVFCEKLTLQNLDIDNNEIWKELNVGDIIPKDTLYILVKIDEIRRLNNVKYELEASIRYNNKYPKFQYETYTIFDQDLDVDIFTRYEKKPGWCNRTLAEILRNECYIGNIVQGKFKNISYKDNRKQRISKEDWIVVENTHEPIIEKSLWYSVQDRIISKARVDCNCNVVNPFNRKIYCSVCGKRFEKSPCRECNADYLVCSDRRTRWTNCDNRGGTRLDILQKYILDQINGFISKFKDDKILDNLNKNMIDKVMFDDKIIALKKELNDNENEIILKDKYFQQLYEDRFNQIISEKQYITLSQRYNEDVNKLQERQKKIKYELDILYSKQAKLKNTTDLFKKYEKLDSLTIEVVNEWIDKIYIGEKNPANPLGREVKIVWNF